MQNYLKLGSWNTICDICGRKFKNTDVRKRWDGFLVCSSDWESRHVADFIRVKPEKNNVRDPRHEVDDQFVDITYLDTGDSPVCTPVGSSAVSGAAVSGCMVSGTLFPGYL